MNCHECQDLLQRRLDGEALPGTPELDQHLASCPLCRHRFAVSQRLLGGLKRLPRPVLPPDFSQRMVGQILDDRRKRRLRMRRRLWATAALAASLLLMALAGYFGLPDPTPAPRPGPIAERQVEPEPPVPEPVPSLRRSAEEAGTAVAALTGRLADTTLEQARLLLTATAPMDVPDLALPDLALGPWDEPLEPAAESLRQAGQGVSEGLQTVTDSTRRAVDFFMRELTVLESR
jgi:hypothetical protein